MATPDILQQHNNVRATETTPLVARGFQDQQSNVLPRKRLLIIFLNLSDEGKSLILGVDVRGLKAVIVSYGVLTVNMFLASACLRDYGLARKAEHQQTHGYK